MFEFTCNDYLFDWISCLIPNMIYFGPYPSQIMVDELEKNKFDIIVNLTEHPSLYKVDASKVIHYPICDNSFPHNIKSYINLIITLKHCFYKGLKIYIHCRGGHGRSSMTCVSLMYILVPSFQLYETIQYVNQCHNARVNLRTRWKKRKSPFNMEQYMFLSKIHKNIYINTNKTNHYRWLLTNSETEREEKEEKENGEENIDESKHEKKEIRLEDMYKFYCRLYTYLSNYTQLLCHTHLKKFILTDYSRHSSMIYNEALLFIRELLCYYE
jgi:hypothetical protein